MDYFFKTVSEDHFLVFGNFLVYCMTYLWIEKKFISEMCIQINFFNYLNLLTMDNLYNSSYKLNNKAIKISNTALCYTLTATRFSPRAIYSIFNNLHTTKPQGSRARVHRKVERSSDELFRSPRYPTARSAE